MNTITKVSDITFSDVADYLRLPEVTASDENYLTTLIETAKSYIVKYTGIKESDLDSSPDFVTVVFVLCQDAYDTRSLYVSNTNLTVNQVVETILGLHSVNLLPNSDGVVSGA